jgi:hypothetical protein
VSTADDTLIKAKARKEEDEDYVEILQCIGMIATPEGPHFFESIFPPIKSPKLSRK